jgi:hypothetical protein
VAVVSLPQIVVKVTLTLVAVLAVEEQMLMVVLEYSLCLILYQLELLVAILHV